MFLHLLQDCRSPLLGGYCDHHPGGEGGAAPGEGGEGSGVQVHGGGQGRGGGSEEEGRRKLLGLCLAGPLWDTGGAVSSS